MHENDGLMIYLTTGWRGRNRHGFSILTRAYYWVNRSDKGVGLLLIAFIPGFNHSGLIQIAWPPDASKWVSRTVDASTVICFIETWVRTVDFGSS